ncbi:hypothetical protein FRC12_024943 [Ceratobasidium sp. 428]|nr:hypothetical protein FRC12_024943 [Ceratobasidium sp. 428]
MLGYGIGQPSPSPAPPPPSGSIAGGPNITQEDPNLPGAYSQRPPPLSQPSPLWDLELPDSCCSTGHYDSRIYFRAFQAINIMQRLDIIRNYYRVMFTLIRGSDHRSSLPVELVICICKYAGFTSPVVNKSLSDHMNCPRFPRKTRIVYSHIGPPPLVLHTAIRIGPFSQVDVRAVGEITVAIQSFKASYWQWKNFFVKIHRDAISSEIENELVWPCFESQNSIFGTPVVFGPVGSNQCRIIDKSHEIWDFFQSGDQFEIAQMGEPREVPQERFEVVVRVRNWWEPTPAMLSLA